MNKRDVFLNGTRYQYVNGNQEYPFIGPDGVPYRKHKNGGGLIAKTATVEKDVHVGPLARVFGNARLSGKVWVTGSAQIGGDVIADAGTFAAHAYVVRGEYHQHTIITERQAA